jgi:hypothetical protein
MTNSIAIENFGNVVPEGYLYYQKIVTKSAPLSLPTAYLKWYNLYPADAPITPEQEDECRAYTTAEVAKLNIQNELGFVLLHRAQNVLLLLICTWRNTNEIWESTYVKEVGSDKGYEPILFDSNHRGTFCVWELGPIWHERHAWVRFLSSKRDVAAKEAYMDDHFSGAI